MGRHSSIALRLSPNVFINLVTIILDAQGSPLQQRLLYSFVATLRTWKDDVAVRATIDRKSISGIAKEDFTRHRDTLMQGVARVAVRAASDDTIALEARRIAAQILAIVIKDDAGVRDVVLALRDCHLLGRTVQEHGDYVLRIMIADVLRDLTYHHALDRSCWPTSTAQELVDVFPSQRSITSKWLLRMQDYLSEVDKTTAVSVPRHAVLRATRCSYWKDDGSSEEGNILTNVLIVLSDQISCIVIDDARGLSLTEYPIFGAESMSVKKNTQTDQPVAVLAIDYLNDKGFKTTEATRAAVRGLEIELESTVAAASAFQSLKSAQIVIESSIANPMPADSEGSERQPPRKHSIAFIDLSSPSADKAIQDDDRLQDEVDQQDTLALTPSQRRFQRSWEHEAVNQRSSQTSEKENPATADERPLDTFRNRLRSVKALASQHIALARISPGQQTSLKSHGLQGLRSIDSSSSKTQSFKRSRSLSHTSLARIASQDKRTPHSGNEANVVQKTDPIVSAQSASVSLRGLFNRTTASTSRSSARSSRSSAKNTTAGSNVTDATKLLLLDGESQLRSLKRAKTRPSYFQGELNWDQDMLNEQEFDIPEDEEDDGEPRPSKKVRVAKKQHQPTATVTHQQKALSRRFKKPPPLSTVPKAASKTKGNAKAKSAVTVQPTLAASRSRRSSKPKVYYEREDSESQVSSPHKSRTRHSRGSSVGGLQQQVFSAEDLTSIASEPEGAHGEALGRSSDFKGGEQGKKPRNATIGSAAQQPTEFSDDSSPDHANKQELLTHRHSKMPTENSTSLLDSEKEVDQAEDSYPMTKADVDATAAAAPGDFTLLLGDFLNRSKHGSDRNGKQRVRPKAPYGDDTDSASNVDASASGPVRSGESAQTRVSTARATTNGAMPQTGETLMIAEDLNHSSTPVKPHLTLYARDDAQLGSAQQQAKRSSDRDHSTLASAVASPELAGDNPMNGTQYPPILEDEIMTPDDMSETRPTATPTATPGQVESVKSSVVAEQATTIGSHISRLPAARALPYSLDPRQDHVRPRPPPRHGFVAQTPKTGPGCRRSSRPCSTSQNMAQKTPVIHFDRDGPTNQGRTTDSSSKSHARHSGILEQTVKHEAFKRITRPERLSREDTPSLAKPAGFDELLEIRQHTDDRHDNFDESLDSEREGELSDAMADQPVAGSPSPLQASDEFASNSSQPRLGDGGADWVPGDEAAFSEINGPDSANPNPSEARAPELGYSEAIEKQQQTSTVGREPSYTSRAGDRVQGGVLTDAHDLRDAPVVGMQANTKPARPSLGINEFINRTWPVATEAISTSSFRPQGAEKVIRQDRPASVQPGVGAINPPGAPHITTKAETEPSSLLAVDPQPARKLVSMTGLLEDRNAMLPPISKRSVKRLPDPANASKQMITKTLDRMDRSQKWQPVGSEPYESKNSLNLVSVWINTDDKRPKLAEQTRNIPARTPPPFYSKLEDAVKHAESDRTRHGTAVDFAEDLNEANERTLVEDDTEHAAVSATQPQSIFRSFCETTVSTDECSSAADDEGGVGYQGDQSALAGGVRATHRNLLDVVMQITKVSRWPLKQARANCNPGRSTPLR